MLTLIPISELTSGGVQTVNIISCPLCHDEFSTEQAKAEHLDASHQNWAMAMMSAFLRQVPRLNG
jgi:hypothetical protein